MRHVCPLSWVTNNVGSGERQSPVAQAWLRSRKSSPYTAQGGKLPGEGVPAGRVETIHYGMDELPAAWGANPPDPVPADARILLDVARLTAQKGLDIAVRALPRLPDDTTLVVLGEGAERKRSSRGRENRPSERDA